MRLAGRRPPVGRGEHLRRAVAGGDQPAACVFRAPGGDRQGVCGGREPRALYLATHVQVDDADGARETCPAEVTPALEAAGRKLGLEVHALLGLRGVSRTDLILDEGGGGEGRFTVLETNTLPGMTSRSLIPKAAAVAGIDFAGVLDRLIRTAGFD